MLWYSKKHGGEWISAAIDKYVYVIIKPLQSPVLEEYQNPIIQECLKIVKISDKIKIDIFSDVPPKSGLGGSGSLEIGLLHALHSYKREKVTLVQLAQEAADIEIKRLKMAAGPQDQYIAALGGIKYFSIDKKASVKYENLPMSKITLNKLEKNLLFFSTKILHDTKKILTDEKEKAQHEKSSSVIKALDDIKYIGHQAKRYLLAGDIDKFGKTFHNHWLSKKRLSDKVSSAKIDQWYSAARKFGAMGGKIMGAGGGGWFVFYVNKNHSIFKKHMEKLGLEPENVHFDWEGTKLLKTVTTSDGVRLKR